MVQRCWQLTLPKRQLDLKCENYWVILGAIELGFSSTVEYPIIGVDCSNGQVKCTLVVSKSSSVQLNWVELI